MSRRLGSAKLLAALGLALPLAGCSPGATDVAIERPADAVRVACRGSSGERHDARLILGLTQSEARAIVKHWGCVLRVTASDGRRAPQTGEKLAGKKLGYRIEVALSEDRVVRIEGIG